MQERETGLSTRDLAGGTTVDRPEEPAGDTAVEGTEKTADDTAAVERTDEPGNDGTVERTDEPAAVEEPPAGRAAGDAPETHGDPPASTDEMASGRRDEAETLLPPDVNADFQGRWENLQTGFVDEPRRTVEQADQLVAEVMQRLAEGFAAERERLEQQWGRGEDISTEDLRVTLQRYRAFFQRLLSA
jgi:hypothetical protein